MGKCIYCGEQCRIVWDAFAAIVRSFSPASTNCAAMSAYGQFLDGLEQTGIDKEKILVFLQADPDGKGSVQDQVTAEMTTELMKVMGISGPSNRE